MNIHNAYWLVICVAVQISASPPPKKHVYFEIDEFIKQLMTSEKFDELADVIAEKAAVKIKNFDGHVSSTANSGALKYKDALRHQDDDKRDSRSEEISNRDHEKVKDQEDLSSEKSKHYDRERKQKKVIEDATSSEKSKHYDRESRKDRDSRERSYNNEKRREKNIRSAEIEKYSHESRKERERTSRERANRNRDYSDSRQQNDNKHKAVKFGKIDTQSFLKNHMTSKELELNFKHLTGELEKHRFNIKKNIHKSDRESDKENKHLDHNDETRSINKYDNESDKSDNIPVKKSESRDEKIGVSKEVKITDNSSNEKELHEQDTFHELNSDNKSEHYTGSANEEKKEDNYKYKAHNFNEKPVPRNNKLANNSDKSAKTIEDLNESVENDNQNSLSDEGALPIHSQEKVELSVNRAHSDESTNNISHVNLTNTTRPIREENGKYFALETSAEYAEYHENAAKQAKQQFINTYKKK